MQICITHILLGSDSCPAESCDCRCAETDNTAATVGGVVAVGLTLSITVAVVVIVILVLRSRQRKYTTGPSKRYTPTYTQ